jgi:hypothetical protein
MTQFVKKIPTAPLLLTAISSPILHWGTLKKRIKKNSKKRLTRQTALLSLLCCLIFASTFRKVVNGDSYVALRIYRNVKKESKNLLTARKSTVSVVRRSEEQDL